MRILGLMLAVLVCVVHAPARADGPAAEEKALDAEGFQKALEGTWIARECVEGGKKMDQPAVPRLTFAGDQITIMQGERSLKGRYEVDTATDPPQIGIIAPGGKVALRMSFALSGGKLTLCLDPAAPDTAPPSLESKQGDARIRVVLGSLLARRLEGHTGPVVCVAFTPDGKRLLSGSGWPGGDRTVRVWDPATGETLRVLDVGSKISEAGRHGQDEVPGEVRDLAISADGSRVLVGGAGGFLQLWDIARGELVRDLKGAAASLQAVALTPDGRLALAGGREQKVFVWDLESGRLVHELSGHKAMIRSLTTSPDGKTALSGGFDRTVRLWDLASGKELRRFPTDGWVVAAAYSPDGKLALAATNADDNDFPVSPMYLWNLETGEQIRRTEAHRFGMTGATFSPDGRQILTCGYDRTVRLWDADTGSELERLAGHGDWVWSVAYSPDGKWAASAGGGRGPGGKYVPGEDFAIRIWDMALVNEAIRRQAPQQEEP